MYTYEALPHLGWYQPAPPVPYCDPCVSGMYPHLEGRTMVGADPTATPIVQQNQTADQLQQRTFVIAGLAVLAGLAILYQTRK